MKEVKIRPKNYKLDSLQNRMDYAKIFNYQKPKLKPVTPQYGVGVGFDLDEIINMFRFKRNKSMLAFQKRLLEQEQEKFVDHRFNKALVRRLTLLTEMNSTVSCGFSGPLIYLPCLPAITIFRQYIKRPSYRFQKGIAAYTFVK